jgi:hypothetical protein
MSLAPNNQNFKDTQYQFSRYLRDPDHQPLPNDIEARRMNVYRELFYNNIEGFISNAFPVLKQITADEKWHAMIRDFMVKHHCKTPLFHEIAREFIAYLNDERDLKNDPIFIKELAHYEWVELALSVSDAEAKILHPNEIENRLDIKLNTSPLAWPLMYHYPVQQISPNYQPTEPSEQPFFLLVYRNIEDSVTFMELNPVSARLIDLLNTGKTGEEAVENIVAELQHSNPPVVMEGANNLILDWLNRGILIAGQ